MLPAGAADSDRLVDLGITSLEAFEIAVRSGLSIEVLLATSTTVSDIRATTKTTNSATMTKCEMQITKDLELCPCAVLPGVHCQQKADRDTCVFVTGATGFLGSHLMKELLDCGTITRCFVLVRGDDGYERLLSRIHEAGSEDDKRVTAVRGDLSRPYFGLSASRFVELAQKVTAIFHVGARVDWLRPYEDLRAANVDGTATAISFALTARAELHHISSGAVSAVTPIPSELVHESGYTASKTIAEALVTKAVDSHGLRATIYRCGAVTTSTATTAVVNRHDYPSRLIESCLQLSMCVDSEAIFETIPVDLCAKIIVAVASSKSERPMVLPISNTASWTYCDLARELHSLDNTIRAVDACTFALAVSRSSCRLRPLSTALQDPSWFANEDVNPCLETAAAAGMVSLAAPLGSEYLVRWIKALGYSLPRGDTPG